MKVWIGTEQTVMAKPIHKLSPLQVQRAQPGKHGDGGGLWLYVYASGSKAWVYRYGPHGKREHGLGSLNTISLAAAREKARACREMLLNGVDPIAARKASRAEAKVADAKALSFSDCADRYHAAHAAGWKSAKHAIQWRASLRTHVDPVVGNLPIRDLDTTLVLKVIEPLWRTNLVTGQRVRQRMEAVWDWARVRGYCSGDNPARWSGHLDHLLAKPDRVRKVKHFPALPFAEVGGFMADLRVREGIAERALEFTILTAARSREVLHATWDEMDLTAGTWTIPATKMKGGREHRVPLAADVITLLKTLPRAAGNEHVFVGVRRGQGLGAASLFEVLRAMGRNNITTHGFRSSFRDWAAERTNYPREVCEAALAHVVGDQTEAAYRRSDLFERRRRLMDDWSRFCSQPAVSGDVVDPRHG
jgi:integrase